MVRLFFFADYCDLFEQVFPPTAPSSKPGMIMGMVLASVPTLGKVLGEKAISTGGLLPVKPPIVLPAGGRWGWWGVHSNFEYQSCLFLGEH